MDSSFDAPGGFYVIGHGGKLAIVSGEHGAYVLTNPILQRWELSSEVGPDLYAPSSSSGRRLYVPGLACITATLEFQSFEGLCTDDVPRDLRLADDMTVRQLLSTVHRKLKEREGEP